MGLFQTWEFHRDDKCSCDQDRVAEVVLECLRVSQHSFPLTATSLPPCSVLAVPSECNTCTRLRSPRPLAQAV
eukprot:scaffold230041_cov35-Prasinocladus_malaysianus.AAC.1